MPAEDRLEELLLEDHEVEEPHDYPFFVGEYDKIMRDRIKHRTPSWKKLSDLRTPEFKEFDKFLSTTFFDLWKSTNIAVDPLTPSAEVMRKVLEIAHTMPEWQQLKTRVENNHALSTVAALTIGKHIIFPEPEEGAGEGDEQCDTDGEVGAEVRKSISDAISDANNTTENAENLSKLWGDEEGDIISEDPEAMLSMLEVLHDHSRLKIVVNMLGRLKNQFHHTRMTRSRYIPEEFVDIELGNNLNALLPSSRMLLAVEELQDLFILKYIQRALLQQVLEGNTPLSKGPIVVLVDVSSSMQSPLGNIPGIGSVTRVDWATAVALTLIFLAKSQDREFFIGMFDTRMKKELQSTSGTVSTQDIIDILAIQATGGTNFEVPLSRGLEIMTGSEYDKADMVFITDGQASLSSTFLEEFRSAKAEREFKVLGVSCENVSNTDILRGFCDKILSASSLMEADATSKYIFSLGE